MTYPSESIFILLTVLLAVFFAAVILLLRMLRKKAFTYGRHEDRNPTETLRSFGVFAREIKSLREQLAIQERLATLGEVSAGIAHELRNPMAVIAGNARLLLKDIGDLEQRELLEGIIREVSEINSIIEELLKFAHNSQIAMGAIELVKLITGIVDSLPERDRVTFDEKGPVMISGDEQLLRQAIKNLINNALESGASTVWIKIEKEGAERIDVQVGDNGKGMTEEEINRIFQPFYSTKETGVGMGLTLVQKIALEHGGSVNVESKRGVGSLFTLSLPMRR